MDMGEPSQGQGAVASGTGTGTKPAGVLSFVSGDDACEEKTIAWKIKHFASFLEMSNEELAEKGIRFEAGTCLLKDGTNTAATWKYLFKHTKKGEEDCFGAFLTLGMDRSKVKSAKAMYSVSLSSGGKPISSFRTEGKEFASSRWGWEKMMTKSEFLEMTKPTDTLELTLIVKVFSSQCFTPVLQEASTSPSAVELRGQMIADFEQLFASGDGADVEVKVPKEAGGEVDASSYTKMVHKGILMGRSSVFAAMFAKESEMVEAKTGKVVIKDLSPKGLDVVLNYIYTGKVSDNWLQVPGEILNAAEKYDLGRLKQYCGRKLISAVTIRNAWEMFQLAKLHKLSFAKSAIAEFVSKNSRAVLQDGDEEPSGEN